MYVNFKSKLGNLLYTPAIFFRKTNAKHLLHLKHQHFLLSYTFQSVVCNLTLLLNRRKIEFIL